ncbi:MAG: 50S ribosomal protein L9 [Candidatus Krumholzibacteriia bacterium]
MEVILLKAVPPLGSRGDTVKVKPGYARNFLFPHNFAIPASESNRRVFAEEEKVLHRRDRNEMRGAQEKAEKLAEVSCTITVQVGDEDKLYGSVTSADISKELAGQGFEVDKRQIMLEEPIRKVGVYNVDIKLHREVSVPIKVWVVKQ